MKKIENEVFKRSSVDIDSLKSYGFIEKGGVFCYETSLNKDFRAVITINDKGETDGSLLDKDTDELYINYRLKELNDYAYMIKEEYLKLLYDIKDKCFKETYFSIARADHIAKLIDEKYQVKPQFIFKDLKDCAVFYKNERKWFAVLMEVDGRVFDIDKRVAIINVKLDDEVEEYLKYEGIYKAYHMNKKKWVSIMIDERVSDDLLLKLVDKSYNLVR